MLFDAPTADPCVGEDLILQSPRARWGADSEYGRLLDVMVSPPPHLEIVPCNSISIGALGKGLSCCSATAERQHRALVGALEAEGVRCHVVPAREDMPDLSFTRDATLMTPWGLLELNPAAAHREAEVAHVRKSAEMWGLPQLGVIEEGRVEGGDICILRPGMVAIGWSGERTDETGARALARLFEARGWTAMVTRFDPYFLHLDTLFTVIDRKRAVACLEALEPGFVNRLWMLGLELIPVTIGEVQTLGANLVSLGDDRILSAADNRRINIELARRGYRVIAVEIDQFTRCGGGIHCLTMPLSREPG
jgi:arginine deiminase